MSGWIDNWNGKGLLLFIWGRSLKRLKYWKTNTKLVGKNSSILWRNYKKRSCIFMHTGNIWFNSIDLWVHFHLSRKVVSKNKGRTRSFLYTCQEHQLDQLRKGKRLTQRDLYAFQDGGKRGLAFRSKQTDLFLLWETIE